MRYPFYIQPDSMDCGPTCLKMVAKFYGKNIPIQQLREHTQIGKDGVSLLGIREAAETIGFRTHAVKLSFGLLINEAPLPAILHWGQSHFVVLYKIKKKTLLIADPAKGIVELAPADFKNYWLEKGDRHAEEGIALLLEPTPNFNNKNDESDPAYNTNRIANFARYLLPYKKLIFQLIIGLIAGNILQLFLPFLTQALVDNGVNKGNIHFIYIVLLAQLALFAGRLTIEFIRGWILLHISTRINLSILMDFLIKLMKLPMSFFDSKNTGDILQRMSDQRRIELFLTDSTLNILFSLTSLFIFSIILAVFNVSIFFVFTISTVLYSFWVIYFLKKRKQLDYRRFGLAARDQSNTIQLIQGMQEIRLHGAEKSMRWNWEKIQIKLFGLNSKGLSLNQWQQTGAFFINEGKNIIITFLSAAAVIDGTMTLGGMLAIQYIIGQLNSPVERIIQFLQSWQDARISIDRLNEIHSLQDEEPEERQLLKHLPLSFQLQITGGKSDYTVHSSAPENELVNTAESAPSIQLKNLSFTYMGAGNPTVLDHLNFTIPLGKTTAIVGASGSGKTTLLKLLLKFYEPTQGDIILGNISLTNISHKVWRQHCGIVMQDSYIFSDTIARNIAIGQDRIEHHKLEKACRLACIDDFIVSLPLAYNTIVGSEGLGISMGQKQRILLARAFYRDPAFIFIDEATNSLDANNENKIVQNLETYFQHRTMVVVAHRLSTVKNADQIIVLDKGRVVEWGTHDELIALSGYYFQLIKNQLELGN